MKRSIAAVSAIAVIAVSGLAAGTLASRDDVASATAGSAFTVLAQYNPCDPKKRNCR